jgi:hypothetical protein
MAGMQDSIAVAFITAIAVQQLNELLDPIFSNLIRTTVNKKFAMNILAATVSLLVAIFGNVRLLRPAGLGDGGLLDLAVSALAMSAGTDGVNSVLKYAAYSKEAQKSRVALDGKLQSIDRKP